MAGRWGGYRSRSELRKAVKEGKARGSTEYKRRISEYTKRHPGSPRSSARGHPNPTVNQDKSRLRSAIQQVRAWINNGFDEIVVKWFARYPPGCNYPGPGNHWMAVRIDSETVLEYLRANTSLEQAVVDISWTKVICHPELVMQFEIEEPTE